MTLAEVLLVVVLGAGAGTGGGVTMMRVPDGGIQPQVACDSAGTVHLIYFKGAPAAGNLFYAARKVGEKNFSAATRVNSQDGSVVAIGSIRGGQLAVGKGNRVHVVWNGSKNSQPKGQDGKATPLLYSRLNDAGAEFEPQRNVITEAYGLDGGGSIAADPAGHVYIAWHANPQSSGEVNRRVYLVHSSDAGATFSRERAIDPEKHGACGCCSLKAFAGEDGAVYVLYRSARQGVNRDMYLLTSRDHGETFRSRLLSRWNVAVCPMSSEAFAAANGMVVSAWEENGQVMFTRLAAEKQDASRPIAAPGSGQGRKHPALAVNQSGETIMAWDKGTGWQKGGSLAWQVFDRHGKPIAARGKADGVPVWSFPAAFAESDGSFVVLY